MSDAPVPRHRTRRLAALALDLLIAALVVILLVAATPLGRVASLPLSPRLLGPTHCAPVTAETRNGSTPMSSSRVVALGASLVCRVE